MKKLIFALLPLFCLTALTACSNVSAASPTKSNIPGLSYTLDLSSDEGFSEIENINPHEEWIVTDVEGENVLFYVEPEPFTTVPPSATFFPSLLIGNVDWEDYSASFEFKTRAKFALYAESCTYTIKGEEEEGRHFYCFEIYDDGRIAYDALHWCERHEEFLKDSEGNEIKIENYDPNVWNKVTLKNENNKLVITVNDQRIETAVRFDGTEHGRLALDGSMLKNIIME